ADDPSLHLVVGNIDGTDGDLGRVRRGVALDGGGEDLTALLLAGLSDRGLVFQDQAAHFGPQVLLDAPEAQIPRLSGGEAADALQGLELVGDRLLDGRAALPQLLLLFRERALQGLELAFLPIDEFKILIDQVSPLLESSLLITEIAPRRVNLGV